MRWKLLGSVLILSALLAGIHHYRLDALLWHVWKTQVARHILPDTSLNLNDYRASIEAKAIDGIEDDLSGLTYNAETNTLFSVSNGKPLIFEIDLDGNLLREIKVEGVRDMEGISHVDDNRYVVVDEYDQRIILVEIDANTRSINTAGNLQISLGISATKNNKNFEGVSWDEKNHRLLVVKERNPASIIEITGFAENAINANRLRVSQIEPASFSRMKLRDFSSITYHNDSGNLLLLSDESRMAVEFDEDGHAISALALWRGFHGLKNNVPQAEGIAIGPEGQIFIVSEPNLFYVFSPPD